MAKRIEKADRPSKTCLHCGRAFAWRRKWASVWQEVRYCSAACRRGAPALSAADSRLRLAPPA